MFVFVIDRHGKHDKPHIHTEYRGGEYGSIVKKDTLEEAKVFAEDLANKNPNATVTILGPIGSVTVPQEVITKSPSWSLLR